jgi:beta-N-acetylhexosaminidase
MVKKSKEGSLSQVLIWVVITILIVALFGAGFAGGALITRGGLFEPAADVGKPRLRFTPTISYKGGSAGQETLPQPAIARTETTPTALPTFTPFPTPTITFTATPTLDPWVEQTLAGMSLPQKIGQMIMMGVNGQAITSQTCRLVQQIAPGAIVYRGENVSTPDQLNSFSTGLQKCAQDAGILPLWIAIDHEGQYVTRFESGVTVFPAAMAQGATTDPNYAALIGRAAGGELASGGVNMVLGPVADVLINPDNAVISQRSFGGDPQQVSQFVSQAVLGYRQAGIIPVLKHFPGHGGTTADTHYEAVADPVDRAGLQGNYLPPFISGIEAGAPVVMFNHVSYPALDPQGLPASLSPAIVSLLRDDLGFQGVILTDSMGMAAVKSGGRGAGQAAVEAIQAGVDMLLVTSTETAQGSFDSLLAAVEGGQIQVERIDSSVRRILQVKADNNQKIFSSPGIPPIDFQANRNLAFQVGYQALALLKNETGLVPLPPDARRILIVGPVDGWGLYPALGAALSDSGRTYQVVNYSGPWNGPVPDASLLQSLPGQAAGYDLILVITWEAHLNKLRYGDTWQIDLVQSLLQSGNRVIVVGLKSPTDILEFPQAPVYLSTFGSTSGQITALADSLVGRMNPVGQNPLPVLP